MKLLSEKKRRKKEKRRETRETSEDKRNRCVKMNNAVIQPLVRCGASEALESPHILSFIGPKKGREKKRIKMDLIFF